MWLEFHLCRSSRGLIQSVSRKTRNILDRLANRRTRTSSADGQLYHGDVNERAISPCSSLTDHTNTPMSHARSTSMRISIVFVRFSLLSNHLAPDVISSSLTSARYNHPSGSETYKTQKGNRYE